MYRDESGFSPFLNWLHDYIYLCFDFKHGVHILSGYNKGRDDSRERQSLEIEKARQLLWKWMESNEAL